MDIDLEGITLCITSLIIIIIIIIIIMIIIVIMIIIPTITINPRPGNTGLMSSGG